MASVPWWLLGWSAVQVAAWTVLAAAALLARRPRSPRVDAAPGTEVALITPFKGVDAALARTLPRFAALCGPGVTWWLAVAQADDAAVPVLERFLAAHPGLPAQLVVTGERPGRNPKVEQWSGVLPRTTAPLLLLVDSNTLVEPGLVGEVRAVFADARVGLASARFVLAPHPGLWSRVRGAYLGALVGGTGALLSLLGASLVVGKCVALSRAALERAGGLEPLSSMMAEDGALQSALRKAGFAVRTLPTPVVADFGPFGATRAWQHQLRWSRLVAWQGPGAVLGEQLVLNPLLPLMVSCLWGSGALAVACGGLAATVALRAVVIGAGGGRASDALAAPLSDAVMLLLAPIATAGRRIHWRGRTFVIGWGARIVRERAAQPISR